MPPAAGLAELLADLSASLTALRVSWYVFGAQAALIWGRPRLTTDVDAGLEDAFLERAIHVDVSGVAMPFISPEDLIVTKILAGRAKDRHRRPVSPCRWGARIRGSEQRPRR